jgi:hypothetical protein
MRKQDQKPPRCSYCTKPSVVWFRRQSWVSKQGSRRALSWSVGACAEHEGCVNWQSHLTTNPTLIRAA